MISNRDFEIKKYPFDDEGVNGFLKSTSFAIDLWPIVYVLNDKRGPQGDGPEAYVGETTDIISRFNNHLCNLEKNRLSSAYVISSEKFNKSATLDLESYLIKYLSGDGFYKLLNGNLGLVNHSYYQKAEFYQKLFGTVWDELRSLGVARKSLAEIDNSDLFKYSPYKTLGREQKKSLALIIDILLQDNYKNIVIEGGSGTGKTILAMFLFKLLNTKIEELSLIDLDDENVELLQLIDKLKRKYPKPKMAFVVPMSSFRKTIQKVFKHVHGLNAKMVIGPSDLAKEKYDIVIVDESHRLRRRVNLGTYIGSFDKASSKLGFNKNTCSELDWVLKQSAKAVFFYDENQSIKPSDTRKENFDKLKKDRWTKIEKLRSQFRSLGGVDYVKFVEELLRTPGSKKVKHSFGKYELLLFDNFNEFAAKIKSQDSKYGLSRLVAGYAWKWVSKKDKKVFDIRIGDLALQWNLVTEDWVNSPNAINQVGCIHTTQGYDLNYVGVIFGNEIGYDEEKQEIVIRKGDYHDKYGKNTVKTSEELKEYILNIYQTLMLRGIRGTYVYVCDQPLRDYFRRCMHIHSTIASTKKLEEPGEAIPYVNSVPLYNLSAAAGNFSPAQKVENYDWIRIPSGVAASNDLFACKVKGNSMNKVIPDNSICLFRRYAGGSRNGLIVLAELSDMQDEDSGSNYTVKEYSSTKQYNESGEWTHQTITLKPLSTYPGYKPIHLSENELSPVTVIGIFEMVLNET